MHDLNQHKEFLSGWDSALTVGASSSIPDWGTKIL